jgi:DNA-binding HxlR family transcriptional regulator
MLGRDYADQDCGIARALERVGERWTLLIIRDALFRRSTRFSEFQRTLGIASNVLSSRLDSLVAGGLFELKDEPEGRRYLPTPRAWDLVPLLMAATDWGDRWERPGPITYVEGTSGRPVALRIVDAETGDAVAPETVAVRLREGVTGHGG